MPRLRPPCLTVLLAALLVLAAAVGPAHAAVNKKKTVSAGAYASALCSHLASWAADLQQGSDDLSARLQGAQNIRAGKRLLVTFLQNTTKRTDRLVREVDAVGVPKVANGLKIAQALHSGLVKASGVFRTALAGAKKLSTSSETKFSQGATEISAAISSGSSSVAEALGSVSTLYPSPELTAALAQQPECVSLSGTPDTTTTQP